MITKAIQITVFVRNQDEVEQFYTEKFGFVVCAEEEFSPGWRYLTVAPPKNNETVLELTTVDTPAQQALIGKQAGNQILVMFATDDI